MTRQKANEADIKPRAYLWYQDDNHVEPIYYPVRGSVARRIHIEEKEGVNERLEAFVSRMKDGYEVGLSFEKNLEEFFNKNKVNNSVKRLVHEACDMNE
jgi:hypothetical protein